MGELEKNYDVNLWYNASKNFPLFLTECELRFNSLKKTNEEKLNLLKNNFK